MRAAILCCLAAVGLTGCDEADENVTASLAPAQPTPAASAPASGLPMVPGDRGSGNLGVLGSEADANQAAFRARFGLTTPTADQLAAMTAYQARLTVYSDADKDWQSRTVALGNWQGTTDARGDVLGIDGTTAAVDFSRVPPHSLLYIPATDQYVEAIDTGATRQWAHDDAGKSDYGTDGIGRVDIQSFAEGRTSRQVERQFDSWISSKEYGAIYIVHAGGDWKHGH